MDISLLKVVAAASIFIALALGILLANSVFNEPRRLVRTAIMIITVIGLIALVRIVMNDLDAPDLAASEAHSSSTISQPGNDSKESRQPE